MPDQGKALGVAFSSPTLEDVTADSLTVTELVATNETIGTQTITTQTVTTGNITTGNITTGNITTGNITTLNVSGFSAQSVANAVSAAGTNQATATALTKTINNVSTVASGTGVNLPASAAGRQIVVQNKGANTLTVYPAQSASDTINGNAATVGVKLVVGAVATFNCTAAGAWVVQGLPNCATAYNTNSATSATTLTAANISGGFASVDLQMTGALGAGADATLPLVTALVAGMPNASAGASYRLRITNASSANFDWTVVTNTGWTLGGTMTIAQNTWREFVVTITSLTTATLQSVAVGTYS